MCTKVDINTFPFDRCHLSQKTEYASKIQLRTYAISRACVQGVDPIIRLTSGPCPLFPNGLGKKADRKLPLTTARLPLLAAVMNS